MLKFSSFYGQVLGTLKSNTIANMFDEDIENFLDGLALRAIAEFRFPRVPLDYKLVEGDEPGTQVYAFTNNVTQKEINVLIAHMKLFWLEQQIDNESNFEDLYYDKDVKTFSRGNMMKSLESRYKTAIREAKKSQYNYSRNADEDGTPGIGAIYKDE